MFPTREHIVAKLRHQLRVNRNILGVSCGSGLIAKQAVRGGADLILALSSGRFRQMGQGSLAGFMPFLNSNKLVMDFGLMELIPVVKDIPVLFGLFASDPTIILRQYIRDIRNAGFVGINNYPTVGLIDGNFRELLEQIEISFDSEVEAIRVAHEMDMFTLAFVFNEDQAIRMLEAGADVICVHLGFTRGGILGAAKYISLEAGVRLSQSIFEVCERLSPDAIRMIYGGPVHTPADVEYIYNNTSAQGYIGGSTFDRIPVETTVAKLAMEFKSAGNIEQQDELIQKMLGGIYNHFDAVTFVKEYVAANYMNKILFSDLAKVAHVSRSHLSTVFHKETGYTFSEYLADFRINKACKLFKTRKIKCSDMALMVGYSDYANFSKAFKKRIGVSPIEYVRQHGQG